MLRVQVAMGRADARTTADDQDQIRVGFVPAFRIPEIHGGELFPKLSDHCHPVVGTVAPAAILDRYIDHNSTCCILFQLQNGEEIYLIFAMFFARAFFASILP